MSLKKSFTCPALKYSMYEYTNITTKYERRAIFVFSLKKKKNTF